MVAGGLGYTFFGNGKNIVDFFCYVICKKRVFRLYLYSSIVQC